MVTSLRLHVTVITICALGKSQQVYIKNTVNVANQLLDSIERDIADSKIALLAKERSFYATTIRVHNDQYRSGVQKTQKLKMQISTKD
jgi:hypothetical protein